MLESLLCAFAIGLAVGLVSSFIGIGGGLLIVPTLPLISALNGSTQGSLSAREVIATSLVVVFLTALQTSLAFQRQKRIDWQMALVIGAFSAGASFFAARLSGRFSDLVLHSIFLVLLAVLLVRIILASLTSKRRQATIEIEAELADGATAFHHLSEEPEPLLRSASAQMAAQKFLKKRSRSLKAVLLGVVAGFISGLTGVGGGIFVVPALSSFSWVTQDRVVPTSVATIVMTSAAGVLAFVLDGGLDGGPARALEVTGFASRLVSGSVIGLVRLDLAAALFLGAVVTSRLGVKYQSRMSPRKRDWLMGAVLLALSLRTLQSILENLKT
jgi:uncharacterized membrane protein YfcA